MGLGLSAIALSAGADTFKGVRSDFRDETIYFAITTRFYDGDPTNNVLCWDGQADQIKNNDPCWRGDFKGLIDRLDYIKALGFTSIWITPIVQNCSGFDYHGYHASDFSKVDLRYESRKAWGADQDVSFQNLIDAAHAKGMKIILDIVLNHTGNFGEDHFAKIFERNQNIRNQATPEGSLIPDESKVGANYWKNDPTTQFNLRFPYLKNTGGKNLDTNNYWHHVANNWNWDFPSRWWGQIAGDCVDLNTENKAVADYLVKCYGEFIKMGVDGFRIDTTGHISRLTFNSYFIPEFLKLGEQYKSKRLNECDFFMFGECCARYGGVTYRDQPNLSCYYYTWKSEQSLIDEFKRLGTPEQWAAIELLEGKSEDPVLNMQTCLKEASIKRESDNVFMKDGAWHEPNYSDYSGFSAIDFPMHYNFNNVGQAVGIAKEGDKYYNDASFNVVYVDSHDYCPGPNDGVRFNGGTSQWAENLSFMFTFRGIPCIYYGSEVEFQKGCIIDKGPLEALKNTGRAYYGAYLEGSVKATDFGEYTASGNVATTLDGDLAHHIRRLNQIRAAVPALRKGQYTWDGCSADGGYAFKRAYKDESYALVAVNGGATFSNVPAGTYTEVVTGKTYTPQNGSITVSAPKTKGQLRVLVRNFDGGKIGTDGKFIYDSSAVAHKGSPSFSDNGTTQYYGPNDVIGNPGMNFSPAGGKFTTETLTVNVELNAEAVSGWYQVDGSSKVTLTAGKTSSFTIGNGMAYGQTKSVNWGATGADGVEFTGTLSYKKVDPNSAITVYVKAANAPYLYAWTEAGEKLNGDWPGKQMSSKTTVGDTEYFYQTFSDVDSFNIIFNGGSDSNKTGDIKGIDSDVFYEYDGGSTATKLEGGPVTPNPTVTLTPKNVSFSETITVTATLSNATSGWYQIGDGAKVNLQPSVPATFTLGADMKYGETKTVKWSATSSEKTLTGSATYTKTDPNAAITVYVKSSSAPYLYAWIGDGDSATKLNGNWPGNKMSDKKTVNNVEYYYKSFANVETFNIILSNGSRQTKDIKGITSDVYLDYEGDHYSFIYENEEPAPTAPKEGYTIYFDDSLSNWGQIKIYVYGNGYDDYLGAWASVPSMLKDDASGFFKYIVSTPSGEDLSKSNVIFHNGSGKQTDDNVLLRHNGIYNSNGFTGKYYQHSGVEPLEKEATLKVYGRNSTLYIESDTDTTVTIIRADGTFMLRHVNEGLNVLDGLQKGFYIVGKTKVIM